MKVRDVMTRPVVTGRGSATLVDACRLMREKNIGVLPVLEGGKLTGMITDRDVAVGAVALGRHPKKIKVSEIMTPRVEACVDDRGVKDAAAIMEQKKIRRL